jgi:biopolymer transport protein ExbB
MNLLHDASLYLLYALFTLAIFLAIERSIFYLATGRELRQVLAALAARRELPVCRAGSVGAELAGAVPGLVAPGLSRATMEDATEKVYIRIQRRLTQNLWLLDTVITAAPLLGLLGTILGIFETFTVLAKSGISDPQGVSAGIGVALLATAIGIGTALVSLVVHNGFLAQVERLGTDTKLALLELSTSDTRPTS